MEFMSKSERICEHGRLLVFWKYSYPCCQGELEAVLSEAANEFAESCRKLTELARSGEPIRASFHGGEEVTIEVCIGSRRVLCRTFRLA